MKVIFKDIPPKHFCCASRAATWLLAQPPEQRDAILVYARDTTDEAALYVRRNKASITVRRTS